MNDPVETLMKQSISAARKYKSLNRKLLAAIDQLERIHWTNPLRSKLELQKEAIATEMRTLSGGL